MFASGHSVEAKMKTFALPAVRSAEEWLLPLTSFQLAPARMPGSEARTPPRAKAAAPAAAASDRMTRGRTGMISSGERDCGSGGRTPPIDGDDSARLHKLSADLTENDGPAGINVPESMC